jgi:hypothetical protein
VTTYGEQVKAMTPEQYRAYMDKLVLRASRFSSRHGGAHPFDEDPRCMLYCVVCGAEVSGFDHRGQGRADKTVPPGKQERGN